MAPPNVCQCGCGKPAAPGSLFIHGHNRKAWPTITAEEREAHRRYWLDANIPYGLCLCGCGQRTAIARKTSRRLSHLLGEPARYIRGHATTRKRLYTVEDRGYTSPCWIVTGWLTKEGYGKMVDATGRQRSAHIVMWERANGPVPAGLQLDHLCRQPSCIRADHLEPVTNAVNTQRSRTAKLTWDDVREIRRRLARGGVSHMTLARQYGVSQGTIDHIATGRNWRDTP